MYAPTFPHPPQSKTNTCSHILFIIFKSEKSQVETKIAFLLQNLQKLYILLKKSKKLEK